MKFGTKNIKELTAVNILKRISEYDIFNNYITELEDPNKPFCSELRKDSAPTCRVSLLSVGWRYKDFGTGEVFSCFDYVMEKYSLTFREALRVISIDFGLGLTTGSANKIPKIPKDMLLGKVVKSQKSSDIRVVSKKWSYEELMYWKQYGITRSTLDKFNVKPIAAYFLNGNYFITNDMAFCYQFGNYRYKILRPNNEYKWLSNSGNVVQGLRQLTPGGTLYITSSLKDVMVLYEIGCKAVAPQSENTLLSDKIITTFKDKFTEVILYYNNDVPGLNASTLHSEKYEIDFIVNPEGEPKDPSDYVKKYSKKSLKQLITHYG